MRDFALVATDILLLLVYLACLMLALSRRHTHPRSSKLASIAMLALISGRILSYSLAFLTRFMTAQAFADVVIYFKLFNTILVMVAVPMLVSAVFADDTERKRNNDWDRRSGEVTATIPVGNENPFCAPGGQ